MVHEVLALVHKLLGYSYKFECVVIDCLKNSDIQNVYCDIVVFMLVAADRRALAGDAG